MGEEARELDGTSDLDLLETGDLDLIKTGDFELATCDLELEIAGLVTGDLDLLETGDLDLIDTGDLNLAHLAGDPASEDDLELDLSLSKMVQSQRSRDTTRDILSR